MKEIVIVGGGVAGLVAALTLKGKCRVTLVEKERECGGLMRSFTNADGIQFDYGTHVLCDTGSAAVDALLFDRIRTDSWRSFRSLRTGSYFAGKLYDKSPHVDIRSLPPILYERAINEILAIRSGENETPKTFADQLVRDFGPTLTEYVHRPAMRKIFACELEDLLPGNHFALKRFVAFDAAKSRELKEMPHLDERLAFASYEEGVPDVYSYYPKAGGVGQWARDICDELKRDGVVFANGRGVAKIEHNEGEVSSVVLDDGTRLPCDVLFWTISPLLLLRTMGISAPVAQLKARPMSLFHFRFDRPFICDNYYVTNYDEALKNFRVTLYPNLQERVYGGVHHCTVEAIGEGIGAGHEQEIRSELETMGIVEAGAKTISCDYNFLPVGFPTLTKQFQDISNEQVELIRTSTRRVELLGRAKHDAFSLLAVSVEAHSRATQLL